MKYRFSMLAWALVVIMNVAFTSSCGGSMPSHARAGAKGSPVTTSNETKAGDATTSSRAMDPFASFETSGPETPWEQDQTRKTMALLRSHRNFDEMLRRVRQFKDQSQPARRMEFRGRVAFSLEEATASSGMAILRRNGKSPPTVLFRIEKDGADRGAQIDFMVVSNSGRFIVVGTSEAGTEETLVRVLDTRTGKDLGDRSYDVQLEGVVWLPDDSGYLYMRGRGSKNVPVQDRIRDISVGLHILGRPDADDIEVVGSRAPGKAIKGDFEDPYPFLSPDGRDVIIRVTRGVNPDRVIFWKKRSALLDGNTEWQRIYDERDRVRIISVDNGRLLAIRSTPDDQYILEETLLDRAKERRTLYTSKRPLEDLTTVGQSIYLVEREIATKHLLVVRSDGQISRVALPAGKSVLSDTIRVDRSTHRVVLELSSWTELPSWWVVSEANSVVEPLAETKSSSGADQYDIRVLEAPARDGERIPMTVVAPKNGTSKYVWVVVYGAYGYVWGPSFTAVRRIFFESGGTFIVAHVRGGGEKGRSWYEQGRGPNKIKTIEDTIDSLKFLRDAGFGKDGGIVLSGGSAGGIPAGGLLVRAPELVDAVFIDIGVVNVSRFEAAASATGAIHRQEFGSDETPEGAARLRSVDAYLNIRDGQPYPATFVRAGVNDTRVPRWQSSKFVARLQQATKGTKPILLHITSGGHGAGNRRDEQVETDAELLTFALSNVRHPEFQ